MNFTLGFELLDFQDRAEVCACLQADSRAGGTALESRNDKCSAPLSTPVSITMTSDALVLAWETPAANQDVRGPLALVGNVQSAIGLAAQNPVQMLLGGSVLDDTNQFGEEDVAHKTVWVNRFDPLGADFEGDLTFRLFARDSLGLPAKLDVSVHLALSLAKLTRYEHLHCAPTGVPLKQIALVPLLDTREPGGWIDALVTSPGKGVGLPYDDFSAMEMELLQWQSVPFDSPSTLLGSDSAAATKDVEVVLRFTPAQLEKRFPLNATQIRRTRRIALPTSANPSTNAAPVDASYEVLTLDPARVLSATAEGVSLVFDITARGLSGVVDARRWRDDKVVIVTTTGVRVCDIDRAQADFDVKLSFGPSNDQYQGENRPCIGVEVVDATAFFLLYSDVTGSRLWKHDGINPTLLWNTSEQVTRFRAQGQTLAFATQANALWSGLVGTGAFAPMKVWQHDAPIIEVAFDDTNALVGFADASRVYTLNVGAAALLGEAPPNVAPWSALAMASGAGATPRLMADGASGGVFARQSGGGFLPLWTVEHGANRVAGLGHLSFVYVAAKGDPLKGGTPAVTSDALAVFVETGASGGAFLALIEKAKQTRDTSTWARGVQRLVVTPA